MAYMSPLTRHPQATSRPLIITGHSQFPGCHHPWKATQPFWPQLISILQNWPKQNKKSPGPAVIVFFLFCVSAWIEMVLSGVMTHVTKPPQKHVKELRIPKKRHRFHVQATNTPSEFRQSSRGVNDGASRWSPHASSPSAHDDKQRQREMLTVKLQRHCVNTMSFIYWGKVPHFRWLRLMQDCPTAVQGEIQLAKLRTSTTGFFNFLTFHLL